MPDKKPAFIETLLDAIPIFLAFLIPVFYLPITTEFFEFNKLALILASTALMLLLWVGRMLSAKKVGITKSPMDTPLIALTIVVILASIFSINKTDSIYGSQGRWFPSLVGVVTLFFFYYSVATNINSNKVIKSVLLALVGGITVSSFVAVLSYFGIALGSAPYLQTTNFTLTGSSVVAGLVASLAVLFSLSVIVSGEQKPVKTLMIPLLTINFLAVITIGSLPAWTTLGVGLLLFAYFTKPEKYVQNKTQLMLSGAIVTALALVFLIPTTRGVLVNSDYPREVSLNAKESWHVVSSIMRDFPILGSGPSTFGLNYTRYKPLSVNTQDYWNIRFDKPYSEAFSIIGSLGVLGIIVSLVFVLKVVTYVLSTGKQNAQDSTTVALVVAFLALLSAMLFTYASVTSSFLLVLLLALITAKNRLSQGKDVETVYMSLSSLSSTSSMSLAGSGTEKEVFQYIVALPITALALVGAYFMYGQYLGEYYMRSAFTAARNNNGSETYTFQQKAIKANPQRAGYHSSFANTNLALANVLAANPELTDEQRSTIQALIAQSIRSSRVATEVVSPLTPGVWESRGNIYRALVGVAEDADAWAVRSYNAATQLDPTNPRLRLSLGGIYYAAGDYLTAANLFNQAVGLKNDYANAHYNLAQALKQLENYENAKRELEVVQRLVQTNSPDAEVVAAEILELSNLPNVAGAADIPTVDELEGAQPAEVVQEPLVNTGEEEVVIPPTDLELTDPSEIITEPVVEETTETEESEDN